MSNDADSRLAPFKPWLRAAAIYNLVWGTTVILSPLLFFNLLDISPPGALPFWRVVGMFVLVYAPGYWWAARNPAAHGHLVLIGTLGKVLGPIGFVWAFVSGALRLRFGLVLVTNDLIWWPSFALYLREVARLHGGWSRFLRGD